jgi:hypothetical protein
MDKTPSRGLVGRGVLQFRQYWSSRLDALGTELARGKRARRLSAQSKEEAK